MLDRIDFNIEQAADRVGAAVTELVGTELPRHTMDMLMSQADEDGSGFVSFAEFVELVNVAAPEPSGGADGPEEELLTGSDDDFSDTDREETEEEKAMARAKRILAGEKKRSAIKAGKVSAHAHCYPYFLLPSSFLLH